ncbi:hypothetical protein ACWDYA_08800, partial [Micrococcus luteus]
MNRRFPNENAPEAAVSRTKTLRSPPFPERKRSGARRFPNENAPWGSGGVLAAHQHRAAVDALGAL